MKRILALIVLFCLVLFSFTACKGNGGKTRPTKYDGVQSVEALLDYAKRLEKNGDAEAAAAIYDLIDKALIASAEDGKGAGAVIDDYRDAQDIFADFGHRGGGAQ